MKHILRVLALCLLLALPACALASGLTSCYWQLEAVEVETLTSDAYGPASAQTSAQELFETDPVKMTGLMRGAKTVSLDVTRAAGGYNAHAD